MSRTARRPGAQRIGPETDVREIRRRGAVADAEGLVAVWSATLSSDCAAAAAPHRRACLEIQFFVAAEVTRLKFLCISGALPSEPRYLGCYDF
jgi:hypothetical protein